MKKTFLSILCLMLTALVLFVSCDHEVDFDPETVQLTLGLEEGEGKSLDYATNGKPEMILSKLQYKMTYLGYTKPGNLSVGDNKIVNPTEDASGTPKFVDMTTDGKSTLVMSGTGANNPVGENNALSEAKLGWCSQGYWKIEVQGLDEDGAVIYQGSRQTHVSKIETEATIYLSGAESNAVGSISIASPIATPALAMNGDKYGFRYILENDDSSKNKTGALTATFSTSGTNPSYSASVDAQTISNVKAGSYILTIQMWNKDASKPVIYGGVSKEIVVAAGKDTKIKGEFEAKDFVRESLDIRFIELSVGKSAMDLDVIEPNDSSEKLTVVFDAPWKAVNVPEVVPTSWSYQWYVNGVKVQAATDVASFTPGENGAVSITFKNTSPGMKNFHVEVIATLSDGTLLKGSAKTDTDIRVFP